MDPSDSDTRPAVTRPDRSPSHFAATADSAADSSSPARGVNTAAAEPPAMRSAGMSEAVLTSTSHDQSAVA